MVYDKLYYKKCCCQVVQGRDDSSRPRSGHRANEPSHSLRRGDDTGLPQDSVANVSLVTALDKQVLADRLRKIPRRRFALILSGFAGVENLFRRTSDRADSTKADI